MSFRDCIQHALNDGVIDRYEAEDLTQRFERLEQAERSGAEPPGFARAELERQLTEEGKEAKRRQLLQAKAANDARHDIHRFAQEQRPDVGEAVFRMFENYGFTGYGSVRNQMNALIGAAQSEMEEAIHAFRRSGLTLQRRGNALLDAVVDAAFGGSNDPGAQALYRAWLAPAEKLRGLFNEAGGNIGWLERYGLPMFHDAGAAHAAGFDKWRDFISARLNWDEMTHGVTKAKILPSERDDVLRHVWESIVTGGWNTRDPAAPNFAAKYAQRQDARFLIFKDADGWRDYNRAFGKGDAWATMNSHIRSMARDVALMQRLGPNPTTTVEWLKNVVMSEAMKQKVDKPNLFRREFEVFGRAPRSLEGSARAQQNMIDALYSIARGDSGASSGLLADAGAIARNVQYAAKLGGAVINEMTSGPIVQAFARHVHGIPLTTQLMDLAKGFSGAGEREATRAGMIVEDALHVLEQGAREAAAGSRLRQLSAFLPQATVRWSGLEAFTNAGRRAFMFGAMAHFADMAERPWSELPEKTRRLLAGHGIRRDDWAAIRLAELHAPEGSAPFLRFSEIAKAGELRAKDVSTLGLGVDEAGAAVYMRDLALKYLAMLQGETERAVPQANWRARAIFVGNSREDTLGGQARRSFAMFKGFAGSFMMTHFEAVKQEIARDKWEGAAAAGAYLILLTAGGMLASQLKAIASGKDLRSIDPTTKAGLDTWGHAMLTSGGVGIFGDFLASDRSSYGHGPLETLAGPIATSAIDLYSALRNLGSGKKTPSEKAAGGAVSFLRNNTPVLSTHWALRAAYNRILLDQLQYLGDRDAHDAWRRSEERLRQETGQGFFWRRGDVAPGRLPQLAR